MVAIRNSIRVQLHALNLSVHRQIRKTLSNRNRRRRVLPDRASSNNFQNFSPVRNRANSKCQDERIRKVNQMLQLDLKYS